MDFQSVRVTRLADLLAPALEAGHVMVNASSVDSVAEWRKAARRAASARGWKVRTGITSDGARVWAARTDLEVTETDIGRLRDRLGYLQALLTHDSWCRRHVSLVASPDAPSGNHRRIRPQGEPQASIYVDA